MPARSLVIALISLATLAALSGCIIVSRNERAFVDAWSGPSETRTVTVPHVAGSRLDVRTRNGSVEVRQGGVDEVQITATIHARSQDRLAKTSLTASRDAQGTLEVRVEWPDGPRSGEGASIVVVTPSAPKVSAAGSNGSILVHADDCLEVEATSSNGSIVVHAPMATVKAVSSNGRIELDRVARADVTTSNAGVRVALAPDSTGPLAIRTSNGPVDLVVGPAFGGTLRADTSNAPVQVAVARALARKAGFDFGPGADSVVTTSNNTIRVHGR
ncbi:MAG: hypothetical protein WCK33_03410 [Phycisphaerae bacterium]|jgi:hypothetical protein